MIQRVEKGWWKKLLNYQHHYRQSLLIHSAKRRKLSIWDAAAIWIPTSPKTSRCSPGGYSCLHGSLRRDTSWATSWELGNKNGLTMRKKNSGYNTPWKINGWNLQIYHLERKIEWSSKPPWSCSMLIFQGVTFHDGAWFQTNKSTKYSHLWWIRWFACKWLVIMKLEHVYLCTSEHSASGASWETKSDWHLEVEVDFPLPGT